MSHDLYTDADKDRPDVICDSDGQVVLGLCKRCGKGEAELYTDMGGDSPCVPRNWTNSKMNRWEPDNNPLQNRRLSKTGEEVNELGAVLFRISNQGIDSIDPSSGKTNRQRFMEETADVLAQCECNMNALFTVAERHAIYERMTEKIRQMGEWEEHYK